MVENGFSCFTSCGISRKQSRGCSCILYFGAASSCCDTEIGEAGVLVRIARGDHFPLSLSFEKYVHCPVLLSLDVHLRAFSLIIWTLLQVLVCKSTVTGALCTKPEC